MTRTKTFEVLGGAYKGRGKKLDNLLTHAATVNDKGYPIATLCKRVNVDHLCPDFSSDAAPTCPVCARKVAVR
jgi:hypothetical protein